MRSWARIVLVIAICLFLFEGWFLAAMLPTWHEEVSVHAAPPARSLRIEDGLARTTRVCDGSAWLALVHQRPRVVLCAGGLAWPIFVAPYIGGMHYWPLQLLRPLHQGDPVALRRTALLIAVLSFPALFLLIERLAGPLHAAMSVSVAALLPTVVVAHSLLVLYEIIPTIVLSCAALVVCQRPDPSTPPSPLRAAAAGALAGLAVLANIKAIVVAVPVLVFALVRSPVLRRTSLRAWLAAAVIAALAASPMCIAALADPSQDYFRQQTTFRLANALTRLDPGILATEALNVIVFIADLGYFIDAASGGGSGDLWPATLLFPGLALGYSVIAFIRGLLRLPHDRLAAPCGALQVVYLVFAWLAYNQTGPNVTPILYAQAVSIACAIVAAGRLVARRGRGLTLGGAAAVLIFASIFVNTYRRGDPRKFASLSINLQAARALEAHLEQTPGGPVVVTNYMQAGIPDALTGEPSLRLDQALDGCMTNLTPERCEQEVFGAVIQALPNARFLTVLRPSLMEQPSARRAATTLESAAHGLGFRVREEARFETGRGVAVLGLLVVERHAAI